MSVCLWGRQDYITSHSSCNRSCRPPAALCSPTVAASRVTNGWKGGKEPRWSEILQTVRGRGQEHVQINVDHHPQQNLRCDQVPGRGEQLSSVSGRFIVTPGVWTCSPTGSEAGWVVHRNVSPNPFVFGQNHVKLMKLHVTFIVKCGGAESRRPRDAAEELFLLKKFDIKPVRMSNFKV